jgi:uncharacterized protein (DUF1800 family)
LQDITLNPAMGIFLNTLGNRAADGRGRMPDENYAREVMQLFTIGLFELNQDGTNRLANGRPIETYSADDVSGLAKVFTGYDYDLAGITFTPEVDSSFQVPAVDFVRRPMTADPTRWVPPRAAGFHSNEAKSFLGLTIPAGTGAAESLRRALDHIFNHANVGPFFSRQMIQRIFALFSKQSSPMTRRLIRRVSQTPISASCANRCCGLCRWRARLGCVRTAATG